MNSLAERHNKVRVATRVRRFFHSPSSVLLYMAIPCVLLVFAFNYVPLFGWALAFFKYRPGLSLAESDFVGLKYFKLAFLNPEIVPVLRNTLVISFLGIACSVLAPIFAIFLNEMGSKRYKRVIQTTTTFPNFISWVIVYSIFFVFFSAGDGVVNKLLFGLGLIDEPTNLLANPDIVWYFQTAIGIWKGIGFSAIVYLASLAGIDLELYDAAAVDGAGRLAKIRHITIPGLLPTYFNLLLLSIGGLLSNGFDQYYVFSNNLVLDKIQVLDLYTYRIGIMLNDYSFSTAIGVSKTLISLILLFFANFLSKRVREQSII